MMGTAIATMNDLVNEVSPREKCSSQCFQRFYITQDLDDPEDQDINQDTQDINEPDEEATIDVLAEEVSH